MTHPLDGARLKIIRAQEHLDALKSEIGRYLDGRPYEVPLEIKGNVAIVRAAVIKTQPPLSLSCILGDCVCNLRASLDYIIWQLATRYFPNPLVVGEDILSFPISKTNSLDPKRLTELSAYNIPATALSLIQSVQPYHTGYEPLTTLRILVNTDKHCLPLLTVACADATNLFIVTKGQKVSLAKISTGYACTTFHATPPGSPGKDVDVQTKATVFVALKDSPVPIVPVDLLLGEIVKCVSDIIPRFDPFF